MDPVSFGLTIVQTIDLCVKYRSPPHVCREIHPLLTNSRWGEALVRLCQSVKHADAEVKERAVAIENLWYRTDVQARFICQIESELDEQFHRLQIEVYNVLEVKLKHAVAQLNGVLKDGVQGPTVKKYKYALVKGNLDQAIQDLEAWQKTFDPSWFLVLRLSGRKIDVQLISTTPTHAGQAAQPIGIACAIRESRNQATNSSIAVFLPPDRLENGTSEAVSLTSVDLLIESSASRLHIVDTFRLRGPLLGRRDLNTFLVNARLLIHRLQCVDSSRFGILQCRGAVREYDSNGDLQALAFVFRPPPRMVKSKKPLSLREMLISSRAPSLSLRVSMALDLATSVCYMHTLGFVHKNVRPENIISMTLEDSIRGLDRLSLFLFGFGQLRLETGCTRRIGDSSWEKNLYRHPSRQGVDPEDDYVMQHDIYSLGVCLLEIGLWGSFVTYNDAQSPSLGNLPGLSIGIASGRSPTALKAHLIAIANEHLAVTMGDRYRTAVVDCLTCLDEGSSIFDDDAELLDDDGVRVGVRYIEKVMTAPLFAHTGQLTPWQILLGLGAIQV